MRARPDPLMAARGAAAILGCEGLSLSPAEAGYFRQADPFGFILFARNIDSPDQLRRLTADLRAAVGRDAPILIDQEGGRVQRLHAPYWREWLPPLDQVARALPGATERGLWIRYRLIAAELQAVGIDANCAPTLDIAGLQTHPFLRNRCLGTDATTVSANGLACAEGLLAGGVLPIMKHLPGHGRTHVDSHLDLPRTSAPMHELIKTDFAPFRALRSLPIGMTGHMVLSAYDEELPATQSPRVIRAIREEIGFEGLLITDDLGMNALTGSLGERASRAVAAGCDVVLHCSGDRREMDGVLAACGRLTDAAAARCDKTLSRRGIATGIDADLLMAELEGMILEQADTTHG